LANRGVLAERRRRQNVRWLWTAVEELLRTRLAAHPAVRAIRDDLEEQASEGTIPIEAAARRLLEAFDMPAATE
jgi:LAO/AO transport system kinase